MIMKYDSVLQNMYEYRAPSHIAMLLRSHSDTSQPPTRFGRGGRMNNDAHHVPFAPNGTAEGRRLLEGEWQAFQTKHAALRDRGVEVRLAGTGRRAPPSDGAPGQHQGSDLYRWNVWLFGFADEAVIRNNLQRRGASAAAPAPQNNNNNDDDDGTASVGQLGRQLEEYNEAAKQQCQYCFFNFPLAYQFYF